MNTICTPLINAYFNESERCSTYWSYRYHILFIGLYENNQLHLYLGDTFIAEKLIKAGADLNEADKAGDTPLMAAATKGIVLFFL